MQTFSGENVVIPQMLGTTVGNNLFHSFSTFNINAGQTVEFTGGPELLQVISRVTGNEASTINGTLKSSIANADFYLINPNGITFGAGALIDVPGAFHISTADKIDFYNKEEFFTNLKQTSTLSSSTPIAFGFLETSLSNNGLIYIDHAKLSVKPHQTFDVVAGNIDVDHGSIRSPSGEIRLLAIQKPSSIELQSMLNGHLPLPQLMPALESAGNINIHASLIDTSGEGGGRIGLWAGKADMSNSKIYADNWGKTDADWTQGVDLHTYILSSSNSWISSDVFDQGNAGAVILQVTDTLTLTNGKGIISSTYEKGDAGNVMITAKHLNLLNRAIISSSTWASGNTGFVQLITETLHIDGANAKQITGIVVDANRDSTGHADHINIKARAIDLINQGSIASNSWSSGNAGSIEVMADSLMINGQQAHYRTGIFSNTGSGGSGQAGSIAVTAKDINIINQGSISSSTHALGDANSIEIHADRLNIDGQKAKHATGIFSEVGFGSRGNAKQLTINAQQLQIINSGVISANTAGYGDAGDIQITADQLSIDGQGAQNPTGVYSNATKGSHGDAGTIEVSTTHLKLVNGGVIATDTSAVGNAGAISVEAQNILIDGRNAPAISAISSEANKNSKGDAGNVNIRSENLNINNQGMISSSTYSSGSAGTVTVESDNITISNHGQISSATFGGESSSKTGDVTVVARKQFQLTNSSQISIENDSRQALSSINPGTIEISAANLYLQGSQISSHAIGSIAAGHIILHIARWLMMDNAFINTSAHEGDGGAIVIDNAGLTYLKNSGLQTGVTGVRSSGGNIDVTTKQLILDTGLIQANAVGGSGGDINLNLGVLIASYNSLGTGGVNTNWQPFLAGFNLIQAASNTGINGVITISNLQLNLSGMIANLGNPQFNVPSATQDYCDLNNSSSLTRKGSGRIQPKSGDPLLF